MSHNLKKCHNNFKGALIKDQLNQKLPTDFLWPDTGHFLFWSWVSGMSHTAPALYPTHKLINSKVCYTTKTRSLLRKHFNSGELDHGWIRWISFHGSYVTGLCEFVLALRSRACTPGTHFTASVDLCYNVFAVSREKLANPSCEHHKNDL